MKISNNNIRTPFWLVFTALLSLSIADFVFARYSGAWSHLFWGYVFIVNVFLIVAFYFLFGKSVFKFRKHGQILEISNELVLGNWFSQRLRIQEENLIQFSIEKRNLNRYLVLNVLQKEGLVEERFAISFLSSGKRERLVKILSELNSDKQVGDSNEHLFI